MTRVPTLAQHQLTLFHTLNTKQRLNDLQIQLVTNTKSQPYSGIAQDALRLVSLESRRSQIGQFLRNIDTADGRLALMDTSISSIGELARDFRALLNDVLVGPQAIGNNVTEFATNLRNMLADLLNTTDGQRYLFGGTRTDRPPVDLDPATYTSPSLIESDGITVDSTFYEAYYTQVLGNTLPFAQGSFYDQIFFEKNGVVPSGPLPGDPDNPTLSELIAEDPDLWQYYVNRLDSAEMLANPKTDYYQGDLEANAVRADSDLELSYDVRADHPAFQQILAALDAVASLPSGDAGNTFERAVISKARDMLNGALEPLSGAGFQTLNELRMRIAGTRETLNFTRERHERFDAYAEGIIHDIETIDQSEVIVRLQSDQQVLEASYAILARLQSLSLLEFI